MEGGTRKNMTEVEYGTESKRERKKDIKRDEECKR